MDILDVLGAGTRRVDELNDVVALRLAAITFLDVYEDYEGWSVYPASPQAERLLGAAMMINPERRAGRAGPTVLVDVNIASGTLLASAATRVREIGNDDPLVGIVLHSLVDGWCDADVQNLSRLIVVHPHDRSRVDIPTAGAVDLVPQAQHRIAFC